MDLPNINIAVLLSKTLICDGALMKFGNVSRLKLNFFSLVTSLVPGCATAIHGWESKRAQLASCSLGG